MNKPIKAALCVILSALFLLSGCNSGKKEKSESSDSKSTSDSASVKPKATEPVAATAATAPATQDSPRINDEEITYNSYEIKKNVDEIDSTLDNLLSYHNFNGAVYVKFGNDYEAVRERGTANTGAHISNSIHTSVYAGELTHFITAVAVMKLTEEKKLDLQTTIDKYFPNCSYAKDVTVEQLLTMKSGIPDYVVDKGGKNMKTLVPELESKVSEANGADKNKQAVLNRILSSVRNTTNGNAFSFSNSNYYLLGEIIAKESGTSYEEYVKDKIFQPIYMTKSGFAADESTARPYTGTEQSGKLLYPGVGYSALGFVTDVSDLLKLIDGLMTNTLVSEASFKRLFTDYGNGYGYGTYVSGIRATCIGSIDAYSAKLSFTTNNNQIYVALSNESSSDPDEIHRLFREYLVKFRN